MKQRKVRGFTLIELLVVIAILGILTIITVSQFGTAQKKARDVQRKSDLNSVSKALLMYYADYGYFPSTTNLGPTDEAININSMWGGGEFVDGAGYVYMKVMPKENFSGRGLPEYCYEVSSDRKMFALFSTLENEMDSEYDKYTGGADGYGTRCSDDGYHFVYLSPNASIDDFPAP